MSASTIIFYILAALVLTLGTLTVTSRKIFRSAVFLLLTLLCIAGIYILMEMQFIAALQIIIYVGGIVVLIIFSIFLTQQSGESLPKQPVKRIVTAAALSLVGFAMLVTLLKSFVFTATTEPTTIPTVENIGRQLLDYKSHGYVLPFEVVSVLLLAALVGSIVIAIKEKKNI